MSDEHQQLSWLQSDHLLWLPGASLLIQLPVRFSDGHQKLSVFWSLGHGSGVCGDESDVSRIFSGPICRKQRVFPGKASHEFTTLPWLSQGDTPHRRDVKGLLQRCLELIRLRSPGWKISVCVCLCIPTHHVFLFYAVRKQIHPPSMSIPQAWLQETPNWGCWRIRPGDGIINSTHDESRASPPVTVWSTAR